jgi:hypothetical protein
MPPELTRSRDKAPVAARIAERPIGCAVPRGRPSRTGRPRRASARDQADDFCFKALRRRARRLLRRAAAFRCIRPRAAWRSSCLHVSRYLLSAAAGSPAVSASVKARTRLFSAVRRARLRARCFSFCRIRFFAEIECATLSFLCSVPGSNSIASSIPRVDGGRRRWRSCSLAAGACRRLPTPPRRFRRPRWHGRPSTAFPC